MISVITDGTSLYRAAAYIVMSTKEVVTFPEISEILPSLLSNEEKVELLRTDPSGRFRIIENIDPETKLPVFSVGLNVITEKDIALRSDIAHWRDALASCFQADAAPIELGRLASAVERPLYIPRQIKLRDILRSDPLKRFKVIGSPNSLFAVRGPGFREGIVSSKPESEKDKSAVKSTSEDITCIKQLWLDRIEKFMMTNHKDYLSLSSVTYYVPKPKGLNEKLNFAEFFSGDLKKRFNIHEKNGASFVTLNISHEMIQQGLELWRVQIADFLANYRQPVFLTNIGTSVYRPWPTSKSASMKDTLLSDPLGRFKLIGEGNTIRVSLVKKQGQGKAVMAASRTSSSSTGGSNPVPTTGGIGAESSSTVKEVQEHIPEPEQTILPSTADLKNLSIQNDSQKVGGDAVVSGQNFNFKLDDSTALVMNTSPFDSNFSHHPRMWSVENSMVDSNSFLLPAGIFSGESENFSSFHSPRAPESYFSGLGGIVDSDADGVPANHPNDAMSMFFSNMTPSPPGLPSMFSSAEVSPRPDILGPTPVVPVPSPITSLDASNSAAAVAIPVPPVVQHVWLKDWLPVIFEGFSSSLIESFCEALQDDGFVSVNDLVIAQAMNQLTFDYLRNIGIKIGHYNRLVTGLKSFSP